MSWEGDAGGGATGWEGDAGATSRNDIAGGAANEDTFDAAGGDNFDVGYSGGASGDTGGAHDGGFRNCGQEGHFARDCDQARTFSGVCFNCGEEGHSKAECTKPRKSSGPCRVCEEEGHQAVECPKRTCKNCLGEGHDALDCKENRMLNMQHVADKVPAEAWKDIEAASEDRDIADFKEAVQVLTKACPEMTYPKLEKAFRKRGLNIYLIALEKDHGETLTVVNLQGELGKKYTVSYFLSDKPQRPTMKERWPPSAEENLKRLEDAGVLLDRGVDLCNNCKEVGHISKACPQEKQEIDRAKVECALCGADGHRARDCNDRPPPRAGRECRVCQGTDHMAKDCPNKEKRTCRNCGSEDHVAKDCDQPRDPAKIQCRNCDEFGHTSRDCTAPKDWSKVKCNNCGEMGHTVKRCKEPIKEEEGAGDDNGGFGDASGGGGGGNWNQPGNTGGSGQSDWETNNIEASSFVNPAPIAASGGSGW